MTEDQHFLFDLQGYLILENVLTQTEIDAANAAIDANIHLVKHPEPTLSKGSENLLGNTGRGSFTQNPLSFDRPWCEPFRHMLTHPVAVDIFNEILGTGFRYDHAQMLVRMVKGTEGHFLHGATTRDPSQYHRFIDGRVQCGLCVASWQLTECKPGDGGFAFIPGSHKLNYRAPRKVLSLDDDLGVVEQLVCKSGSLVIFNEALIHGALPWKTDERERRSILFKLSPGYLAWGRPPECMIQDPTEEELALFEPPYRTNRPAIGMSK
ncbi:MAG: phytanoyl-CoA dioxygenase family protein [Planctomycetota bacterium]|nr:phytanoyl-CoA dioxygenase family protein [Planctomycetota bacterium]MDA1143310.1 phytanoyl-CoA dioxygenase family protein [Planctomycetota bacterium]